MVFVRVGMRPELLARISAWSDDLPGRDRWVLQFYPPGNGLVRQEDDGENLWRRRTRWDYRVDHLLGEGEIRQPRATAAAAVKLGLELLTEHVPKPDLAALEKVAAMHVPTLERTSKAYLQRFRLTFTK